MANIQIGIDASQAAAATQQFEELLKKTTAVMGEFTVKTLAFNEAGQLATGTIEQINKSGQRLTSTFDTSGNSAVLLGQKITQAGQQGASAGQAIFVSWQQLLRIFEVQIFRRVVTEVTNATLAGIQAAADYQTQLQQVANTANLTGLSVERLAGQVRGLSERFGVPVTEVLTSTQVALGQQLGNTTNAMNVLNQAMTLSNATGLNLNTTTRLLTTSLAAFNLPATQAAHVTDILFSASQRTRGGLENLSISIGRISQVAGALGIGIEEVIALFETLESQGGRPTEAFSLLNVALGRLINPSQAMQQVLRDMGVSSAQTGIQALGLAGFLDRLSATIERVPDALREVGGSTRGIRADLSITGDFVRVFEERFRAGMSGAGQAAIASARVNATAGAQFRQEIQAIKNIFTEDIGGKIIGVINSITKGFGGARVTVEAMVTAIGSLIGSFVVMRFAPGIITLIDVAFVALTNRVLGANTAIAATSTAIGGLSAAFAAAYAAGLIFFESQRLALAKIREETIRARAAVDASTASATQRIVSQAQADQREFAEAVRQFYRPAFLAAEQQVAAAERNKESILQQQREIAGAFKVQVESFLDTLRAGINTTRENIREIRADIDNSLKSQTQFAQSVRASQFQRRLSFTTQPEANLELLRRRIQEVQQEINNTLVSGDRLAIRSASEKFTELKQLEDEFARTSLERQRAGIEARRGGEVIFDPVTLQRVRVITLDISEVERRSNSLIQQRVVFEERRRALLQQIQAAEEASLRRQQNTLRTFDTLLKLAEEFKIFNQQGRLLPQFQAAERAAAGGGVRQAIQSFDELSARIRAAAQERGQDLGPINELLAQQRNNLIGQIQSQNQLNRAVEERLRIDRQTTFVVEEQARISNLLTQRQVAARDTLGAIGSTIEAVRGQLRQIPETANELSFASTRLAANVSGPVRQAFTVLEQAQRRALGAPTLENINALDAALRGVEQSVRGVVDSRSFANLSTEVQEIFTRLAQPNRQSGLTFIRDLLTGTIQPTQDLQNRLNDLNQQFNRLPAQQLTTSFNNAGEAAVNAGTNMNNALTTANQNALTLNLALATTIARFNQLGNIGGGVPAGAPNFAEGGLVSGPPDSKHILAWVGVDEFIMNATSTRKFFTQLVAMNSGRQPRSFAQGGPVTNVGDIHLNLSNAGGNDANLREIGRGLRREIRRGTIRFT